MRPEVCRTMILRNGHLETESNKWVNGDEMEGGRDRGLPDVVRTLISTLEYQSRGQIF